MEKEIYYSLLKDYVDKNGVLSLRVFGGSMRPWIKSGEKIKVKKVNTNEIKTGDVIFYELDGQFLVHRVIKIRNKNGDSPHSGTVPIFIVAGDSRRDVPEYLINKKDVLGKVEKSGASPFLVRCVDMIYQIFGVFKNIFLRKFAQNE